MVNMYMYGVTLDLNTVKLVTQSTLRYVQMRSHDLNTVKLSHTKHT